MVRPENPQPLRDLRYFTGLRHFVAQLHLPRLRLLQLGQTTRTLAGLALQLALLMNLAHPKLHARQREHHIFALQPEHRGDTLDLLGPCFRRIIGDRIGSVVNNAEVSRF